MKGIVGKIIATKTKNGNLKFDFPLMWADEFYTFFDDCPVKKGDCVEFEYTEKQGDTQTFRNVDRKSLKIVDQIEAYKDQDFRGLIDKFKSETEPKEKTKLQVLKGYLTTFNNCYAEALETKPCRDLSDPVSRVEVATDIALYFTRLLESPYVYAKEE